MRPYVICHMRTTVDGRILGRRWGKLPGYKHESDLFETTAASFGIGAWLVGTTTMGEFDGRKIKLPRAPKAFGRGDPVAKPNAKRLAIGAEAKGVLRFQASEVGGDHVVLLVTTRQQRLTRSGANTPPVLGGSSVQLNASAATL